ncbi:hypothetical protein CASFOL_004775 [Castilleja foliolosa]|uniref:Secreted protein n=1 Tax=Castilleja foliolosa TaxID=1961234 RepID=A0ABD3EBF7_9LAMI
MIYHIHLIKLSVILAHFIIFTSYTSSGAVYSTSLISNTLAVEKPFGISNPRFTPSSASSVVNVSVLPNCEAHLLRGRHSPRSGGKAY